MTGCSLCCQGSGLYLLLSLVGMSNAAIFAVNIPFVLLYLAAFLVILRPPSADGHKLSDDTPQVEAEDLDVLGADGGKQQQEQRLIPHLDAPKETQWQRAGRVARLVLALGINLGLVRDGVLL